MALARTGLEWNNLSHWCKRGWPWRHRPAGPGV